MGKPSARPIGVTIISVLGMIVSIMIVLMGLLAILLGAAFGALFGPAVTAFGGLVGVIFIIIGGIIFIANWFLWKMKKIGWILVIIFEVIGLLAAILTLPVNIILGIVEIIINGLVIFYLYENRNLFK